MPKARPLDIQMIAGLGNPGPEYALTRHNAGFNVVDGLAQDCNVSYWKNERGAQTALIRLDNRDILLVKPQSYMNKSGGPLSKLMADYEVNPEALLVIHDELDIGEGEVKLKFGGGHAGHNGLRSIIEKVGSRDFSRLRIGIGRPPGRMSVSDYVLSMPRAESEELFTHACAVGIDHARLIAEKGVPQSMQRINTKES